MKKIKLIFAGTAGISTPLLHSLKKDDRFEVTLVVTQEDRPAGRKMELTATPVKETAQELKIPVFQPTDINAEESIERLRQEEADVIVVMAYGQILKPEILKLPPYGCLNVHASILPKYRGASPIQSALLEQEEETGISLMQMGEKMDTGAIYETFKIPIESDDDRVTLTEKIAYLSGREIPGALHAALNGDLTPVPQEEKNATYCRKIQKSDGLIDWNEDSEIIHAKVRAFTGWPGGYTWFKGKRLKILEITPGTSKKTPPYGTVFREESAILIATANGAIFPLRLQMEGKKAQEINEFINGNPDFINAKLTNTP